MTRASALLSLLAALLLPVLGCGSGPARADSPGSRDWTVDKSSGEVFVKTGDGAEAALGATATLSAGQSVRTGAGGRVMLTRGEEMILVSPNSEVLLKSEGGADLPQTVIEQRAGVADFRVDRRTAPHFEVQTPYLAALVKGTVFHVAITPGRTRVDVSEGKVQVTSSKTGEASIVAQGQAAVVDQMAGHLTVVGSLAGGSGHTILGIDISAVQRLLGVDDAVASAVVTGALLGALFALLFAAYHILFRR